MKNLDAAIHKLNTLKEYQEYILEVTDSADARDAAKKSQELIEKVIALIEESLP